MLEEDGMLRKAIELVRRAGLRAYHGSDEPDIEELAAHKPGYQYGGDIGSGVYVSENYETAAIYGKFVYMLDLDLDWREIFDLSAENQHQVEGYEGQSVLVGESIPPFYFFVGKDKYLVSNTDDDIGGAEVAKEMLIESLEKAGLQMLIPVVRAHGLPSIDDLDWHLNDLAESDEAQAAIVAVIAPMVAAAEAWLEANEATVVALDEIGDIVEAAGYKALYFERSGTAGDEILVFDPANVRIVEKATKTAKMRIHALASTSDMLDAIQHADIDNKGWTLSDFDVVDLGMLSYDDLLGYDDLSGWLEFTPGELKGMQDVGDEVYEDLAHYRGEDFAERALQWKREGFPPIVIITAPVEDSLHTQIGDGRGRVNIAVAFGLPIPAVHLIWRG
jgi:hypothetical protein